MPIYEYHCTSCQRTFEVWQKISDGPVSRCEHCGSRRVKKLISQSSFHLKGSGWYVTDYARKGKSSEASPSAKAPASDSSKPSGAADKPSGAADKPRGAADKPSSMADRPSSTAGKSTS